MLSWITKIDLEALSEDLRKLGLALAIGGVIGAIVDTDHVTATEGSILFFIGLVFWRAGLSERPPADER